MNVRFSSTYRSNLCTITTDLSEYTARLGEPFKQMLVAAMARRIGAPPLTLPDGVRLQRVSMQNSEVCVEVSLGSLSNGYRMDAVEKIQGQIAGIIEPTAESFLETLKLMLGVVAAHEGNGGMSHTALTEELHSLRQRINQHYDRNMESQAGLTTEIDTLSARLAWVESRLRTLPLIGQRFGQPVSHEDAYAA